MDQFDREIRSEVKQFLTKTINIEEHEKQRFTANLSKFHKRPRKLGYYAALTTLALLIIVLILPSVGDLSSKLGEKEERPIDNHIEKEPVIEDKDLPVYEEPLEDVTEETPPGPPAEGEIFTIVKDLFENIRRTFNEAGVKYGWNITGSNGDPYGSFDESEYGPFAEELSQYAIDELINGGLLDTARDYCFTGCDAYYFPSLNAALRFNVSEQSENQATVTFIEPANFLHFGMVSEVTILKEDGIWKLSNYSASSMGLIDFKLTKEEADHIAALNGKATFVKQVETIHTRSYITEDNSLGTKDMESTVYVYYYPEHGHYEGFYSDNGGPWEGSVSLEDYIKGK